MAHDIIQLREEENLPFWEIAQRCGFKSWERARDAYYAAKRQPQEQRNEAAEALAGGDGAVLDDPVRPLGVLLPGRVEVTQGGNLTAFLWGDTHMGYESDEALSIVHQVATDLKPSYLVHMGDLLDCYKLSRFDKNPERMEGLQDEINKGRQHLAQMRLASPNSKMILLEGNHEDRLRRVMWNADETSGTLMRLTNVRRELTWPRLLGLDELGIEFFEYNTQASTTRGILPKWILKHGSVVRKNSAYTARGEWEKYGRSGSSGHTHRLGVFYHRDHNGSHCWVETGSTCRLDPEYVDSPDWQNGCVVLTFEKETGAFAVEPVYIHNGLAVWRDNVYRA